jgi:hypothetical protein
VVRDPSYRAHVTTQPLIKSQKSHRENFFKNQDFPYLKEDNWCRFVLRCKNVKIGEEKKMKIIHSMDVTWSTFVLKCQKAQKRRRKEDENNPW